MDFFQGKNTKKTRRAFRCLHYLKNKAVLILVGIPWMIGNVWELL